MEIAKIVKKTLVKRPRSEGGTIVTLSNALARAGTTLTLNEKRIVMLAISKLSAKGRWDGVTQLVVKVTAKEFAETFDIDIDTAYNTLLAAVKHIYERSIHFCIPKDPPRTALRVRSGLRPRHKVSPNSRLTSEEVRGHKAGSVPLRYMPQAA